MNLLASRYTIISLCIIVSSTVIASPIRTGAYYKLPNVSFSTSLIKSKKANWFEDLFFKVRAQIDTKLTNLDNKEKTNPVKKIELPFVVESDHLIVPTINPEVPSAPLTPPNCGCAATCAGGQLGGQVWEDYNSDGVKQSFENTGVGNITVTAYDCNGTVYGPVTTNACGYYTFGGAIATGNYPVRLEFSNIPTSYNSSSTFNGSNSRTTVQKIPTFRCDANLGLTNPTEYCQVNPKVVIPQYVNGDPLPTSLGTAPCLNGVDNPASEAASLTMFNSNTTGDYLSSPYTTLSKAKNNGAVWGVAYQKKSKLLFSSAVIKRHVGLGPLGLGGIYLSNTTNGTNSNFIDVNTLGINTGNNANFENGADRGLPEERTCPNADKIGFDNVGKAGIGDLDISEDGTKLFFVNLLDRKVYGLNITNPAVVGNATLFGSWAVPNACSNPGDNRPWALKYWEGNLYVGTVCSAESTQNVNDLKATVYKINPVPGSTPTQVLQFPLNFAKGNAENGCGNWNPWTLQFPNPCFDNYIIFQQPIFSDIEFDGNGDMILGFLDRTGFQTGDANFSPNPETSTGGFTGIAGGDLLRAGMNANMTWTIENNAVVNGCNTGAQPNNNQGPGGGEYYADYSPIFGDQFVHPDATQGGLAMLPGSGTLITNMIDPAYNVYWSGGVIQFDNLTGNSIAGAGYAVFRQDPGTFGKAAGLGDIEALCDLPPVQIGNYVWLDTDHDGIQDPCESPLVGVNVTLYTTSGSVVATKTTDGNGEYYFSTSDGLLPNTMYYVAVGTGGQFSNGKLSYNGNSFPLTLNDKGAGSNPDINDSDGIIGLAGAPNAVLPYPAVKVTTGAEGSTNHTLDFGFTNVIINCNTTPVDVCASNVLKAYNMSPVGTTCENPARNLEFVFYINGIYYQIKPGTSARLVEYTDGTMRAFLEVVKSNGTLGNVDNSLGFYMDLVGSQKTTGTPANPWTAASECSTNTGNWTFYNTFTLNLCGTGTNLGINYQMVNPPDAMNHPFQLGTGANIVSNNLGGGLWLSSYGGDFLFNLSQITSLSLTTSKVDAKCGQSNGSATVTASGGTTPYTYKWSNGATSSSISNLTAGTYTVTVTDNNQCTKTASVTIISLTGPTATTTKVDAKCGKSDGSATANPTGGTTPYTYIWSNGGTSQTITGISAGTYTVTVKDNNNCTATATATVGNIAGPTASITKVDAKCGQSNGSATASATGGTTPYTFKWNTGAITATISNIAAGIYTVTVTDFNLCTASATITINNISGPTANLTRVDAKCGLSNGSATVTPSGGTSPYTFKWSNGGTTATISNIPAGSYTVTVTDNNQCTAIGSITVENLLGPTSTISKVDPICGLSNGSATVTPSGGTTPYTFIWSNGGTTQTIINLSSGTYSVTVTDNNNCSITNQITLPVYPQIVFSIPNSIICSDSILIKGVQATGGTPGFTYTWNNGLGQGSQKTLPATTATYTVTATDSKGCTATATFSVTVNTINPGSIGSNQTVCSGSDPSAFTSTAATGQGTITYQWQSNTIGCNGTFNNISGATSAIYDPPSGITQTTYYRRIAYSTYNGLICSAVSNCITITVNNLGIELGNNIATCDTFAFLTGTVSNVSVCNSTEQILVTYPGNSCGTGLGLIASNISSLITNVMKFTSQDLNSCVSVSGSPNGKMMCYDIDGGKYASAKFTAAQTITVSKLDYYVMSAITCSSCIGGGLPYNLYIIKNGITVQTLSLIAPASSTTPLKADININDVVLAPGDVFEIRYQKSSNDCIACITMEVSDINIYGLGPNTTISYHWDNGSTASGISVVNSGTYCVTATDCKGCTATDCITVNINALKNASATNNGPLTCSKTSVTLTAFPQTGVTYLWSGGGTSSTKTVTTAGTYTVTITTIGSGCTAVVSTTVGSVGGQSLTFSKVDPNCELSNGSINLTVVGGTPNFSYLWSNGAISEDLNNLPKGTYTVTVTDANQCKSTTSVNLVDVNCSFDLALMKVVKAGSPASFKPGDNVTFTISVINQGTITATGVQVTDYIPTGLTLNDANWSVAGSNATLVTPIASIAPGATVTRDITFTISSTYQGATIRNWAEISAATNALGLQDVDSTPDGVNFNQPGETDDLTDDNVVNQNGKAGGDEDDHDPAQINLTQTFDLALTKVVKAGSPASFKPGDNVTFTISVINQGTITATGVQVTDYIPTGLTLNDANWSAAGSNATLVTPIASIAPGATVTRDITFTISSSYQGATIRNWSEISAATNALGLQDVDSTPDGVNFNQPGETDDLTDDNVVNQNGKAGGDEDDHDPAQINMSQTFDLALMKVLATGQSATVTPGSDVKFTIQIINQGTITGTNISVVDYIPTGMTLNDPAWTLNGSIATLNTPISSLAPGATVTRDITLKINANFQGSKLINRAEISAASNSLGLLDIDSKPDAILGNDADGKEESPADNAINGNGTGVPGGSIASTDEDDEDPAVINLNQTFDLALTKKLAVGQSTSVSPGSDVKFTITVYNQGTLTATSVNLIDYIPTGMSLNDANWSSTGSTAILNSPITNLLPGTSTTRDITLKINSNFQGSKLVNLAEISSASNSLNLLDKDSKPDTNPSNDADGKEETPADDAINGNGTGTPGGSNPLTDEDDSDPSVINLNQVFDLALVKKIATSQVQPITPGQDVKFTITVYNQGTITATNIKVADYIPSGMTLNDPLWTAVGSVASLNSSIATLVPGASVSIDITLKVNSNFEGTKLVNRAEISSATNALNLADKDSKPDAILGNDADGKEETAADDAVNGNGTGIPGGSNPSTDEDDEDPALINLNQIVDLALRKTNTQSTPVQVGQDVLFTITVINQGTLSVQNVGLIDYLPLGMTLSPNDNNGWVLGANNTTATKTLVPLIAPKDSSKVNILLRVLPSANTGNLKNAAEITSVQDKNFNNVTLDDIDSTPDGFNNETNVKDDVVNENGKTGGDEDDHDISIVKLDKFDLALIKTLKTGQASVVAPGSTVTFTITLTNQGTLDGTNIHIADYIPTGLTLVPNNGWTQIGNTATLNTVIPTLAVGQSTTRDISFTVNSGVTGQLVNRAEISSASNQYNFPDIDSKPDAINGNDAGGQLNSPADNAINGNGTGTPGDGVAATDEDDEDPAAINVGTFDLALTKTLKAGQPSTVSPGDVINYTITIINQGTVTGTNIQVTDYIPSEFTLIPNGIWTSVGSNATLQTPIATLAPGASTTRDISFKVNNNVVGKIVNVAEISSASNAENLPDQDSKPDAINGNDAGGLVDSPADNAVNGNGTGTPGDGVAATDEDDSDPASINVGKFDLALTKVLTTGSKTVVSPGDTVSFTITAINQGTVDGNNIQISDYIPSGLSLITDGLWSQVGTTATLISKIPSLAVGASITKTIRFKVNSGATGKLVNRAEISEASNTYNLPDIDSKPDAINGNDAGGLVDSPADNAINGNGTGAIGDGNATTDEDDEDPASITVQTFDLALVKQLKVGQNTSVTTGDVVSFTITVFNQGTVNATNIQLTDYIPTGLTLVPNNGWVAVGNKATLITPISSLFAGATTTRDISFTVNNGAVGQLVNRAEISSATNVDNLPDIDSKPDNILGNDADGKENSSADNAINGNGTGTPGGSNATTDEDDEDPAVVNVGIFDLALTKKLKTGQAPNVSVGDVITFTISVINQGTVTATNVVVSDYIPTGLTLLPNPNWAVIGNVATLANPITGLAPGQTKDIDISFTVNAGANGQLVNRAEISSSSNTLGLPDIDSKADATNGNDAGGKENSAADDAINGNGTGLIGGTDPTTDEDDEDPAVINVGVFDLALTKTLKSGQSVEVAAGDNVTFTITIYNQGTVTGNNIQIADYIPTGLTIVPNTVWSVNGNIASLVTPIPTLLAGQSTTRDITFKVNSGVSGQIINRAEISAATNALGLTDIDSKPDAINGNDAGGLVNSPADNAINGNGTGLPNGSDPTSDEDDEDPAAINVSIYDAALTKKTAAGQSNLVAPGDNVKYTITVYNQGTAPLKDIKVVDYVPTGMSFTAQPNWSIIGGLPTTIITGPLAPGASTTVDITLQIDANFTGTSLVNKAEIAEMKNNTNVVVNDVDSKADANPINDAGGKENSPSDDSIAGNGTGTPGDTNATTDEDDEDPAYIGVNQVVKEFDLALTKKLSSGQSSLVAPGDNVTFTITVYNQGTIPASQITVTDYVPAGMTFVSSPGWSIIGGKPTTTIAGLLAPGTSTTVNITLKVDATFTGTSLVNVAEISSAKDENGVNVTDIDSKPDTNPLNDAGGKDNSPSDDAIAGNGTGVPGDTNAATDEDDQDPAYVGVNQIKREFDLALTKKLALGQSSLVAPGDNVTFTITVYNQGTIPATQIQVTDYVPNGMTFISSPGWSLIGGKPTASIAGPLAPGTSTTLDITLKVDATYTGTSLVNKAEISSAKDENGNTPTDIDSTPSTTDGDQTPGETTAVVDDKIDGNGKNGGDEDDHDISNVGVDQIKNVFDLALTKKLAFGQSSLVSPGDNVTFTITVYNQGTIPATQVQVTDYVPAGMTFVSSPGWFVLGGKPTTQIAGTIAPGTSTTVDITLKVNSSFTGTSLTNKAEISSSKDANGNTPIDFDSTPSSIDGDQTPGETTAIVDDKIDGNGKNGEDEDDHDLATVGVNQVQNFFDLALTKRIAAGQSSLVAPGDNVKFTITVYNQGTIAAKNVEVTDYVPTGMTFISSAGWSLVGGKPTTLIAGPINPGTSTTVDITLKVDANYQGFGLVNRAEISAATDANNNVISDIDSKPDNILGNDAGGKENSPADDAIAGNGTGIPNGTDPLTDEDDEDPAYVGVNQIQETFDLALTKKLAIGQSSIVNPGDLVTYEIKVYNQGTALATSIVVSDYIPTGMTLEDANWNQVGNIATLKTPIASLAAGTTTSVFISLRLNTNFQGTSIKNVAEISTAKDKNGNPATDIDSNADQINGNDAEIDDEINKTPATGDEDDSDPATINVNQVFDLALTKKLAPNQISIVPGDNITFLVKVYNQGTVDATSVAIIDYIPTGMTLKDPTWSLSGANATQIIPYLAAGQSIEKSIVLKLDANYQGTTILNKAEISSSSNILNLTDKDSQPDTNPNNDAGGKENTPSDDAINGNGTGTPGDANASTDEDDEDPALVNINQTFDLALTKKLAIEQSSSVNLGDNIVYTITVFNQGTIDATQINLVDYIPTGLVLNDPNWTLSGGNAVLNTPIAYLAKGTSINVNITFKVNPSFAGSSIRNFAEITSAKDNNGNTPTDIDSNFDNINGNGTGEQNPKNDVINENGNTGGDEDDHDYEDITTIPCSLTIVNATPSTCSCSNSGADVTVVISWASNAPKRIINVTIGSNTKTIDPNLVNSPATIIFNNILGTSGNVNAAYIDGSCPSTSTFTITKDTEKPVFSNIPVDRTIECKEVLIETDPIITDNCTKNVPFTFKMDTIPANCGMIIKCIWTATDNCGNIATAIQTVTVKDTKAPVLTNQPNDITIECGSTIPSFVPIWSDQCDNNLTLTARSSVILLPCGEVQTYVYTATDDCNNTTTHNWKITILDTQSPILTNIPQDITIECGNLIPPYAPIWEDVCDKNLTLTSSSSVSLLTCGELQEFVYTATDDCGNITSKSRKVYIIDTQKPNLIGCPSNTVVDCEAVPPPAIVTVTDICDKTVKVNYNEIKENGNCTGNYTLTRTWTSVDNCNNNSNCIQVITVRDTKAPVMANVPANTTIECDAIPAVQNPTATDNCSGATVTYNGENKTSGNCAGNYTLTRTWTATDGCGNSSTASQVITVKDSKAPIFANIPANTTVECDAIPAVQNPTATDNCSGATVRYEGEVKTNGNCAGNYTLTRTWTATDGCNNSSTASQVITVRDTKAPVLANVPANTTVECDAIPAVQNPTATDNCSGATVRYEGEVKTNGNCAGNYTLTRTWTATDGCNNSSTASQVITVRDTKAPVMANVPANTTVECDAIPAVQNPTATDNCSGATVRYEGEVKTNGNCAGNYTLTRTWTATDGCGNSSTASQVITVKDTKAPVLANVPANTTVECDAIPAVQNPTATDNCSGATVRYEGEVKTNGNCAGNYTITRTWTATDGCNNSSTASQVITVRDTKAPVMANVPANTTVECDAIPAVQNPTATDNCSGATVTYNGEVKTNGNCAGNYTITRTWTATDGCNNSSTASQVITVRDTKAPVVTFAPSDITLNCTENIPSVINPTGKDNCDNQITVTYKGETKEALNCPGNYKVIRKWDLADNCNNITSVTQIITIKDNSSPTFTSVPQNITVECDAIPVPGNPSATDDCSLPVVIVYNGETKSNINCTSSYILTRKWTASDACGNSTTAIQTITVRDTKSPIFTVKPSDLTVSCNDTLPGMPILTATDNCDSNVEISVSVTTQPGTCNNNYVVIRTFTATDDCGNTATYVQRVSVGDNTAPSFVNFPDDINADCSNISIPVPNVTAIDNCDPKVVTNISFKQDSIPGLCKGSYTLTRTWTATDICGNVNSKTQKINVGDATPPNINNLPVDVTVECSNIPAVQNPTATDNCGNATIKYNGEVRTTIICIDGYTLERSWTATDECGNSVTKTQMIVVRDKTAPVSATPTPDVTVDCGNIPNVPSVIFVDNCDTEVTVFFRQDTIKNGCNVTYRRTWTALDNCGNRSSKVQNIVVIDNSRPEFVAPLPIDITISCDAPLPNVPNITATDNCSKNVSIDYKQVISIGSGNILETITRTWIAIDDCGNKNEISQKITRKICEVFDLALLKRVKAGQPSTFTAGDNITFEIEVSNQGNVTATQVNVVDYVSTGLILNDANWTVVGSQATLITPIASIAAGGKVVVEIRFQIDPTFAGGKIRNVAEIVSAKDANGNTPTDKDSTDRKSVV